MGSRAVYSVSFTVLCLSLVALGYLSRKPFCISSKFVQSIDRVGKDSSKSLPQCGSPIRVSYDESLKEYKDQVEHDLNELSSFFKWIGGVFPTLKVNVLEYEQDIYRLQSNQLFISKSLLRQPRKISRSIIRLWIQNLTQDRLPVGTLLNESLTDFMEYLIHGELILTNSAGVKLITDSKDFTILNSLRFLMSTKDYCSNIWRLDTDINACKNSADQQGFAVQGLRPLITSSLITAFTQMSELEKLSFYKKVTDFLTAQRLPSGLASSVEGLAVTRLDLQTILGHVSNSVRNADYKLEANKNLALGIAGSLRNSLALKGEALNIELAVQIENPSSKLIAELKKFSLNQNETDVALMTQDDLLIAPHNDFVSKKLWGPLAIAKKIWIHCGTLDTHVILKNSQSVEQLTVIDACTDDQLDVRSFLEGGIKKFALSNREVPFLNIHVPSLEYSLSKNKQSPVELVRQDLWKKISVKNNLAWKEPIFDQVLNAYSVEAEIGAIDLFRNSSLKNNSAAK
jgi:hypothetical protein